MIYIYDRNEKQIAHLDIVPTITEEIGKLRTLEFESEEEFEKGYRVITKTNDGFFEFIIVDSDYSRDDVKLFSYFCQDSLLETQSIPILDKRPWGNVEVASKSIFENTRWVVEVRNGYNMSTILKNSYYHITVLEAFSEMVEKYCAEWITEFKVVGSEITERRVVLYQRDGKSKGRLEFGKNITKFERKILSEPIITALYVHGKGEDLGNGTYGRRISISSVNGGKDYIENVQATKKYGLGKPGQKKPLFGFIIFEEETDPANLLKLGKQELEILSQVRAEYIVNAINLDIDAKIGYEVAVIDEEIGYRGYSRIIKIVRQGDDIELTFGTVTKKFVDSVQKTLKKTEQGLVEVFEQVNNIKTSADGKTTVFTGASEPLNANEGDMWYRYNADGTVDILFFKNGEWEEETGQKVFKKMQDDLNASKALIDEAKSTAEQASKKVDDEVEKMGNELSLFKTDTDKVLSIIKDPSQKGLLSVINQQAGNILFQVGDNNTSSKFNLTKDGTYMDKEFVEQSHINIATINDALLGNVKFEWAAGKTLNAEQVNVINIDANNITANRTTFVQSAWNAINSSLTIDGNGMKIDGDWGGAINFTRRGLTYYDKIKGQVMGYNYGLYRNADDPRAAELMQGVFLGAELGYNLKLGIRTDKYNQNTTFLEINGLDKHTAKGTVYGELDLKSNLRLNENSIIIRGNSGVRFGVGEILGNTVTYMVNVQGTAGIGFTMGGGIVVRRYDSKAGATIWKWL
ncbi:hypothetical protein GUI37_01695 [Helcococcus kunzii]|uniref:phage tail spike protein n=1 Tax=Helcococcus kunzii TaxID=40091 RepID=UPI001BAF708A|nr:phage tail spike protein [Helcococcus kunzii]QUY64298.1 hypothetical protein GUI37_01695 [Helcococcus kunzii]